MKRSIIIVLILTACPASTRWVPPDDAREAGVRDLRSELGLAAPVGTVDAGWLVLGSHRLIEVPRVWDAQPVHGTTLLFEGAPGVALALEHERSAVARYDHATGKAHWAPAFVENLPSPEALLELKEQGPPADEDQELPRVDKIIDAGSGQLRVRLDAHGLHVERVTGERLFSEESGAGGACSYEVDATVGVGRRAGVTWVFYQSKATGQSAMNGCTGDDGYRYPVESQRDVVVMLPADGGDPRVVRRINSDGGGAGATDTTTLVFEVPGGTVEYGAEYVVEGMAEPQDSWSWTYTPAGGQAIPLVDGH